MTIRHVSGTRDHAAIAERLDLPADAAFTQQLIEYEDDMPTVYAAADFVVCRAGASSVAEVAVAGLPSVLVPLPGAPGDHQTANARALVDAGAAVLVADGELDADRFAAEVDRLLDDPDRLASMAAAASSVAMSPSIASPRTPARSIHPPVRGSLFLLSPNAMVTTLYRPQSVPVRLRPSPLNQSMPAMPS